MIAEMSKVRTWILIRPRKAHRQKSVLHLCCSLRASVQPALNPAADSQLAHDETSAAEMGEITDNRAIRHTQYDG
jgi:hypothetical protein